MQTKQILTNTSLEVCLCFGGRPKFYQGDVKYHNVSTAPRHKYASLDGRPGDSTASPINPSRQAEQHAIDLVEWDVPDGRYRPGRVGRRVVHAMLVGDEVSGVSRPHGRAPQPTTDWSRQGLSTIPQCTGTSHEHTMPLYCTSTLYTFSHTASTNQSSAAGEPYLTDNMFIPSYIHAKKITNTHTQHGIASAQYLLRNAHQATREWGESFS